MSVSAAVSLVDRCEKGLTKEGNAKAWGIYREQYFVATGNQLDKGGKSVSQLLQSMRLPFYSMVDANSLLKAAHDRYGFTQPTIEALIAESESFGLRPYKLI